MPCRPGYPELSGSHMSGSHMWIWIVSYAYVDLSLQMATPHPRSPAPLTAHGCSESAYTPRLPVTNKARLNRAHRIVCQPPQPATLTCQSLLPPLRHWQPGQPESAGATLDCSHTRPYGFTPRCSPCIHIKHTRVLDQCVVRIRTLETCHPQPRACDSTARATASLHTVQATSATRAPAA